MPRTGVFSSTGFSHPQHHRRHLHLGLPILLRVGPAWLWNSFRAELRRAELVDFGFAAGLAAPSGVAT